MLKIKKYISRAILRNCRSRLRRSIVRTTIKSVDKNTIPMHVQNRGAAKRIKCTGAYIL